MFDRNTTDNNSYYKNDLSSSLKLRREQCSNISNIKVPVNIKMSLEEYKGILIDILLIGVPFSF